MVARISPAEAEQIMSAAGFRPLAPYVKSLAKWPCVCTTCGEESTPTLAAVRHSNTGCRFCAGNTRYDHETAAAIMRERGLEPLEKYPGAREPWPSRCVTCKAEVSPQFSVVKNRDSGCQKCARAKSRTDAQEAATFMLSAGWETIGEYPGASAAWPCRCTSCGTAMDRIYADVRRGTRCPVCTGTGPLNPRAAAERMEASGLRPLEPFTTTATKWKCECLTCGRTVYPRYSQINQGHGGCGFCAGSARFTDEQAAAMLRKAGFEPAVPYPGSSKPWPCTCIRCGFEAAPSLNSIRSKKIGCRACAGFYVAPEAAEKLMRDNGLDPQVVYPGSARPWRCRCMVCGFEVSPNYSAVRRGLGGCTPCGASLAVPGRSMGLYVMVHEGLGAVKVGIGVVKINGAVFPRVDQHRWRGGWVLHARWFGYDDHRILMAVERRVLRRWQAEGIRGFVPAGSMPQGGWSETAPLARVNLDDLVGEIMVGIGVAADALLVTEDMPSIVEVSA